MTTPAKPKKTEARSAAAKAETLAAELLECHLAHELAHFQADSLVAWIQTELNSQLDSLRTIPLGELVSADQIRDVIARNVVDNEIPGAIAELAGDAATRLFSSDTHRDTPLNTLLDSEQVEEWVDKLLELKDQRTNIINHLIDMPIYQELISGVLYQAILRYIVDENIVSKNVPGVSSMLKFGKRMMDKTVPKLGGGIEDNVRAFIAGNLKFMVRQSKTFLDDSLTDEDLKASAMELWESVESKTLGKLQSGMDSVDLAEFVVLGYEFWLRFRKTDYFSHCCEEVVDHFFEVYGENELGVLLDDLAITPERMMTEVEAFAPRLLATLEQHGQIEGLLRRRLESFYTSDAALACLKGNG